MMKTRDVRAQEAAAAIFATGNFAAKDLEGTITKGLAVCQEQGLFASALFFVSRGKNELSQAKHILAKLLEMVKGVRGEAQTQSADELKGLAKYLTDICSNVDEMLLVKQVWEQTLIYGRLLGNGYAKWEA